MDFSVSATPVQLVYSNGQCLGSFCKRFARCRVHCPQLSGFYAARALYASSWLTRRVALPTRRNARNVRQPRWQINALRENVAFPHREFENGVGAAHGSSVMSIAFLTPLSAANFHVNRQNFSLATLGAPQHHDCQRRSDHKSKQQKNALCEARTHDLRISHECCSCVISKHMRPTLYQLSQESVMLYCGLLLSSQIIIWLLP